MGHEHGDRAGHRLVHDLGTNPWNYCRRDCQARLSGHPGGGTRGQLEPESLKFEWMSLSCYKARNNETTSRSRPIRPTPNLSFFSCLVSWGMYNFLVPPSDDFGDWATPKEPTVGHFFCASKPTDRCPLALLLHW